MEQENNYPVEEEVTEIPENPQEKTARRAGSAVGTAGKATKRAGITMQAAGKTARAAGTGMNVAGKGVKYAGKGVSAAGQGLTKAGTSLSGTGVGALVGVPLAALGAATTAVGKGAEVAGTAVEKAGQATNKAGKSIDNAGKQVRNTGKKLDQTGKNIKNNSSLIGNIKGFNKFKSLKIKLIIIGIAAGLLLLILFLVVMITPLMELGIIEIGESGSTSNSLSYISSNYSYSESVNVEGDLYSLEEYVAGVLEAEVGAWLSTGVDEALKAQAIAARTYVVYHTDGGKNSIQNSIGTQKFDPNPSEKAIEIAKNTEGMVLSYNNDLFLSQYDSFCYEDDDCPDAVKNSDGTYTVTYTILPSGEKHTITLSDESYYNDIVYGGGHARGMSQLVAFQLAKKGNDYKEILGYFYSQDVEIIDLKRLSVGNESSEEGLDYKGTYTNLKSGKTYKNFKQYLYKDESFTFTNNEKLANTGCGTTSAGIVLYGEDNSITPVTLFKEAGYSNDMSGHIYRHYKNEKKELKFCSSWSNGWCNATNNNTKIENSSTKEELISTLNKGGTAILFISYKVDQCKVNSENWTTSQHFFVALDYNEADNTIYISNPGNNKETQNGWISIDDLKCVHVSTLLYPETS